MDNNPRRKALEDVRGWAAKGAARDAGKRHGVTLPEDSDFPEPLPEAPPGEEAPPEADPATEAMPESDAPAPDAEGIDVEALLALLSEEG